MKYKVVAPYIELHTGVLTLTKHQAEVRMHNLKKTKGGYEIVHPVQFKRGEEIGYEGELTHELAEAFGIEKPKNKARESVQTSAQNDDPAPEGARLL